MVFLESGRLIFRSHEVGDRSNFIEMQTNPEVRRWVGGRPWPREKAEQRFDRQFLGEPSKVFGLWATILKEDGSYIGYCGLNPRKSPREGSLAFYISRPWWGKGYATEAAIAFIEHGFGKLGLEAIYADVEKGNDASQHILHKLGFTFVEKEEIPNRIFLLYRLSPHHENPHWSLP